MLLARTTAAQAQDVLDAKSATEIRLRYLNDLDTVHVKVMALANAIPEDKYSWRPAPGVRSISEALMHIATEWYYFTPQSVAMKAPADFGAPRESIPKLEKITKKSEVLEQLAKSWEHCKAQVGTVDPAQLTGKYKPWDVTLPEAAFVMAGDLHEHLGQMIAYARSVGVKPPWSK
ncbi:MAG: DinB family protein [Gemmatimonadaceae bacterium]